MGFVLILSLKYCTTGQWFSPGTPISSTYKTDRHDIAEILLKVALDTINELLPSWNNLLKMEVLLKKNRYRNICFWTSWCNCWLVVRRTTASNTAVILDIPCFLLIESFSEKGLPSSTLASNPYKAYNNK